MAMKLNLPILLLGLLGGLVYRLLPLLPLLLLGLLLRLPLVLGLLRLSLWLLDGDCASECFSTKLT